MGLSIAIPKELSHLKIDKRGYPVPYFVSWINGEPEFRYLDPNRLYMIFERKICHICGEKLPKDFVYFISGPIGLQNRVSSDAGMHRGCAEFSLMACPHLFLQKAARRENDELGKAIAANQSPIIKEKPTQLMLVKASKWKAAPHIDGNTYIRYVPHSYEIYQYVNGKLEKQIP